MGKKTLSFALLISLIITAGCGTPGPASSNTASDDPVHVTPISISEDKETIKPAEEVKTPSVSFASADIPKGEWQTNVTFPDWAGYTDDTLFMNSIISFKAYEGQGKLYIEPSEGVTGFNVYLNETKLDTAKVKDGGSYVCDISGLVKNGTNTVSVTNICPRTEEAKVRVMIPYPAVLEGSPADVGISEDSLKLISDLIEKDVEYGFTSSSLAVVRYGRLVYANAWGNINSYNQDGSRIESGIPATADTMYDLASVTKMFSVNYAVQKLVTEERINVTDRISDYLGKEFYENVIGINYSGRKRTDLDTQKKWKESLTIRDLLCHQGGFPADPRYFNPNVNQSTQTIGAAGGNVLFGGNSADAESKANTLKQIFKTPLMYEPGTETLYSDVDYMVLGFLIEKVTGESLDVYLKHTFFDPMGLKRITYNPLQNGFTKEDCAATELNGNTRDGSIYFPGIRTYTLQGEVHDEKAYYSMGGVSGHAGLFASASDLARLASCMLTGGYENNSFFSRNTIDSFTAPKSADFPTWGLGWWREAENQRVWYFGTGASSGTVGHQGWTGTLVMIDPERELVVTYLTNKINSPLADKSRSVNRFYSSGFTSATLGFAAQILSAGMDAKEGSDIKGMLLDGVADMAAEAVKLIPNDAKPGSAYVMSAAAKISLLRDYAVDAGHSDYLLLADELFEEIKSLIPGGNDMQGKIKPENKAVLSATPADAFFDEYLPMLSGKKVAVFTNHTGIVGDDIDKNLHIVDALIEKNVNIALIFAPEHGFRGDLDAGAPVSDTKDEATGLYVYSAGNILKNKEIDSIFSKFDTLLVDIQDVGVRFYTYHITMFELMEAASVRGKEVIVLDRPSPNGFYTDGPVLNENFSSNVGRLRIPVVHGLTLGEMAQMVNGEGWLSGGKDSCSLTVIPCRNYTHADAYILKVNPSPNLRTKEAVLLYPSTCLFENTVVSCGRGTENPFAIILSPYLPDNSVYALTITPTADEGAQNPPFAGKVCTGRDLSAISEEAVKEKGIDLSYLTDAYKAVSSIHPELDFFGTPDAKGRYWIDFLFGTDSVRKLIVSGADAASVKASWAEELSEYNKMREKYLIYP
ncbi:MAG: penicillin binding protein PBP4B [Lachnospiraceae bacterium]|nr:penicillin binding protein PBP4B [Lachnospiraceae bacterium]